MPKRSIIQHKRVSKKVPSDGDPNPKPTQSLQFPRFGELPPEARLQIWRAALHQATVNRTIHVEVHPQLLSTAHACVTSTGVFCGQHGSCPAFREGLPHWSPNCMSDGYFACTDLVSSPEDTDSSSAMAFLSLACHESRKTVLELYPKALKVYQGPWHPGAKSRLVRCRPESDVLVIYAVPDVSMSHTHYASLVSEEQWRAINERQMKQFPYSNSQFAMFREMVSCFQHVAIYSRLCGGGEISDLGEIVGTDLFGSNDMMALLLFFTSLKHLYFWIDPICYPNAWDDAIPASNVEDLKSDEEPDVKFMKHMCGGFIYWYNERAVEKMKYFVADDIHWVPQPKLLERIGCYCPPSWLR